MEFYSNPPPQPEVDESETIANKLDQQLISKFGSRLAMWMKDHTSDQKFPVTFGLPGEMIWLNRAERRKRNKLKSK